MAKTIKDMAIEAYPIIENGEFKQSPMEYEVEIKQKRGAYFKGANAVLKEIEKALVYPKNDGQRIMIEKKIKELKGE